MANWDVLIKSPLTQTGDDIFGKYLDSDFSGADWTTDNIQALEKDDINSYVASVDETKACIFFRNGHLQTFVAEVGTGVITAAAHGILSGEVVFLKSSGTLPAPWSQSTLYYARDVNTNTFKIASSVGGAAIASTTTGTGTHTITATSKRSKALDTEVGNVGIKLSSLTAEGETAIVEAIVASAVGTNAAAAATQTVASAIRDAVGLEAANLGISVAALINKKNATDNLDGSFTIAIRNSTDTATLATIKHWPLTGDTIVL